MVSIEATSKKYRGKMASGYEAKRKKQVRWDVENEVVTRMLRELQPRAVIDVPVGTGRFFSTYNELKIKVVGVDSSEEMLALASKKIKKMDASWPPASIHLGDATKLDFANRAFDGVVCVRFLDLIDEKAMRQVVKEICRVAGRFVVLTIRLGQKYVPKSNTAEHDEKKFRALVRAQGFEVLEEVPVFKAGWNIVRLGRKQQ